MAVGSKPLFHPEVMRQQVRSFTGSRRTRTNSLVAYIISRRADQLLQLRVNGMLRQLARGRLGDAEINHLRHGEISSWNLLTSAACGHSTKAVIKRNREHKWSVKTPCELSRWLMALGWSGDPPPPRRVAWPACRVGPTGPLRVCTCEPCEGVYPRPFHYKQPSFSVIGIRV
jgi:hypothetical protein